MDLEKKRDEYLSDEQLLTTMRGKAVFIRWGDISGFNNLDDIFGPVNVVFVLYEYKPYVGHWIALLKNGKGCDYEFFDSMASMPDEYLPKYNYIDNKRKPLLGRLIMKEIKRGKKVEYNSIQLQSKDDGVSTCGRWCLVRAITKNWLTVDQFDILFYELSKKYNISTDDLITKITKEL